MGLDRRDFLKTLGLVGVTVAVGDAFGAAGNEDNNIEFRGILYDSARCVGCQTCENICSETNGLLPPVGEPKTGVNRNTDESNCTVLNCYNTSKGEIYIKKQCMHCNEPACVAACLTKAMYKTKEGPVIWRGNRCMGCRYCMISCPFDIPKFEYYSPNPKIRKCTMCFEKISKGGIPACVENCPAEALKFGTRRELISEARKRIAANPETYVELIYGEHEAGGTAYMYLSPVPFKELGINTTLQNESYPKLSKGFLYSVPAVFVLLPSILLGLYEATKNNKGNENNEGE